MYYPPLFKTRHQSTAFSSVRQSFPACFRHRPHTTSNKFRIHNAYSDHIPRGIAMLNNNRGLSAIQSEERRDVPLRPLIFRLHHFPGTSASMPRKSSRKGPGNSCLRRNRALPLIFPWYSAPDASVSDPAPGFYFRGAGRSFTYTICAGPLPRRSISNSSVA